MSTIDWLTDGRVGWNIVTGINPAMFANLGLPMPKHDERYEQAHEYMEVLYKLWEQSWERDASVHSIDDNVWADPDKVHTIDHESERFSVKGPHQVEPSPQGTPLLFQAGISEQGKEFAARHAELQFIGGGSTDVIREYIAGLRQMLVANGRGADNMMFATATSMAVGRTEEEAHAKRQMILDALDYKGIAAKLTFRIGVDLTDPSRRVDLESLTTGTEAARAHEDRVRGGSDHAARSSLRARPSA